MDSCLDDQSTREFHPKAVRTPLMIMIFFIFLLFGFGSMLLFGEEFTFEDYLIFSGGLLFSIAAIVFSYRLMRTSKKVFLCDSYGIKEISGDKEKMISWSEIADMDLSNYLGGGGELRIKLLDDTGKKLLSINTEYLPRGGRDLLDILHIRLKPLFEKKTAEYLNGKLHWAYSIIKDVFTINPNHLIVEFPKSKKQIILFSELKRVEWLPGCISGSKQGYLLIEHSAGKIEVPQGVKGLQYFIYALKHQQNLSMVNPTRSPETTERLDSLRRKEGNRRLCIMTGAMMFLGMFIPMGIILWDYVKESQTESIGETTIGIVAEKLKDDFVVIKYADMNSEKQKVHKRVKKEYYAKMKTGDPITIKVHPFTGTSIDFEGMWKINSATRWGMFFGCSGLSLIGAVLLFLAFYKKGTINKEIAELDQSFTLGEAKKPEIDDIANEPTRVIQSPENATPPQALATRIEKLEAEKSQETNLIPEETILNSSDTTKTCHSCGITIEDEYFLTSGNPWCRTCRDDWENVREKPGCLTILRIIAFGLGAAMLGGGLWALIVIMTGYELGLIAILLGLMVGHSVKLGARGYRGRLCQVLAIILTFVGLSYSTIPIIVNEYRKNPDMYLDKFKKGFEKGAKPQSSNTTSTSSTTDTNSEKTDDSTSETKKETATQIPTDATTEHTDEQQGSEKIDIKSETPPASVDSPPAKQESLNIFLQIGLAILVVVLGVIFLFVAPIFIYIVYLVTSPLSAIFTAIALWEAWRINKIEKHQFQGPFQLGDEIDLDKADFTI